MMGPEQKLNSEMIALGEEEHMYRCPDSVKGSAGMIVCSNSKVTLPDLEHIGSIMPTDLPPGQLAQRCLRADWRAMQRCKSEQTTAQTLRQQ